MVGGTGDDTYVVTANGIYSGDTIIEYTNQSAVVGDTLRLSSGFGAFNGTVRLVPTGNGMDLLVYPVLTGVNGHDLPYIKIYNHFTLLGRVEWIEWGGNRIALPANVSGIGGWNNAYYRTVSAMSISYVEKPDGSLFASASATGGPGTTDTVSFDPLKDMRVTADLSQRIGTLWSNLNSGFQSLSVAAVASALPEGIPVDLTDMENVVGSNGDDDLTGSAVANGLSGGEGDDTLSGGLGNDYLDGGSGVDSLFGGGGEDLMDGGEGADSLSGGADSDSYFVDDPADFVVEGATEGTGDRIYTSVSYTLGAGVYVETLSTASDVGADPLVLAGNELNNRIIGNAGTNTLYGMGGDDRLEGLAGDDTYVLDSASDVVVEAAGQGYDRVYSTVSFTLATGSEVELLSTPDYLGIAAINLTGNEFGNAIYGNAAANLLIGLGGDDYLYGATGADTMRGGLVTTLMSSRMPATCVEELAGQGVDTIYTSLAVCSLVGTQIERLGPRPT